MSCRAQRRRRNRRNRRLRRIARALGQVFGWARSSYWFELLARSEHCDVNWYLRRTSAEREYLRYARDHLGHNGLKEFT